MCSLFPIQHISTSAVNLRENIMANNSGGTSNFYDSLQDEAITLQQRIVLAAIQSIDFSEYKTYTELEQALCQRVITIRDFVDPRSVASQVAEAIPIFATIKSVTYEESSTRFVINYVADRNSFGENAEEHIRSNRTDGKGGASVRRMWENLKSGDHVIIYKTMEETGDRKKPSVRVAPYVKKLNK